MAKIFRLHTGGKDTISHWDQSTKMGRRAIDSISDPIEATNKYEITSIPSPFARIDLVKQAFKIVADTALDGMTAYHKLVSDSLDVGQIFFNIEKYRKQIEIIVWDKTTDLAELLESDNDAHQRLGKTYATFLQQDGSQYNFNQMDCIYLLNYIDPSSTKEMDIIGATSPATLFFTSANDLEYVGKKIKFGDDSPFDSEYKPLYKRNIDYIKYWWSLKKNFANFTTLFPEVDAYLEKTYAHLTEKQRAELKNEIKDSTYYPSHYDEIPVIPTAQQSVMVLNEKIRRKKSATQINSGFEVKMSAGLTAPSGIIPLALPVDKYTEPTFYVESNWNPHTYVPYFDARPINSRTLPDDGSAYPYITVSDLLEDTLVRIPYKLNSEGFFDGNDSDPSANSSYLLPLKKTFFDYFTASDLIGKIGGKNRIELVRLQGGAVKVVLRVPIKGAGEYVKYDRIYYKDGKADISQNKGTIIEREFTLGLYPGIKYPNAITPYYRVALLDIDSVQGDDNTYSLEFYDLSNHTVSTEDVVYRNRNSDQSRFDSALMDFATYILKSEFQYIMVENENDANIHGVVIPKFAAKNGNHSFRFAIDFGTTNTHIEYSMDGTSPQTFQIAKNESQIQKLHYYPDSAYDVRSVFDADFIPETIGGESPYNYPMRTVLSEGNNTNWGKSVWTMGHVNIPYTYEKQMSFKYDVLHTDLKWSTNNEDRQRASKYIESLLILLRNKVLLNNGDLKKTEIVWFYPASMTQNRYNRFKAEWEKKFTEIFGAEQKNIISISESIAPYYFYKNKAGATATTVSVDIGGGTTDVLLVNKGEPTYLTSFRFAANSIFGDGYSFDSETNGFVRKYATQIDNALENIGLGALQEVLKSFIDKRISTDVIAFMFSLASNKEVKDKHVEIDLGNMLGEDNRAKYVILLFYVAIMYHIAKIMKAKNLDMPRHVTFSGNGSKVLNILSTNDETLIKLTKLIFEQIYDQPYSEDGLEIIRPKNSKESTCKGGILLSPFKSQDYSEIKELKTILVGIDGLTFCKDNLSYGEITDDTLNKIVKEVKNYIEFTFNLNKKFSFYDNFEIDRSIMNKVKDIYLKDIKTYLSTGIARKVKAIQQDGADEIVEETLFFYPIIGMLNAVVRKIYDL